MYLLLSLLFASFLHARAIRQSQSFSSLFSICLNCHHPIHFIDKFPIFSYLQLRGKCRNCKEPFSINYFIAELMGLILGIILEIKPPTIFYLLLIMSLFYNFWLDVYTLHLELSLFLLAWLDAFIHFQFDWLALIYIALFIMASSLELLGWGDTILMSAMVFRFGFLLFNWFLVTICFIALLVFLFVKKDQKLIAFGPFLCFGYLVLLYIVP